MTAWVAFKSTSLPPCVVQVGVGLFGLGIREDVRVSFRSRRIDELLKCASGSIFERKFPMLISFFAVDMDYFSIEIHLTASSQQSSSRPLHLLLLAFNGESTLLLSTPTESSTTSLLRFDFLFREDPFEISCHQYSDSAVSNTNFDGEWLSFEWMSSGDHSLSFE